MRLVALSVTAAFAALVWYAYNHKPQPLPPMKERITVAPSAPSGESDMSPIGGEVTLRRDTGYSRADVKRLEIIRELAVREARNHEAAMVLADVYHITPRNIGSDIFGEAK